MEQFEQLEKEISDICKDKKIKFRWTNCYYNDSYKLEFKTEDQKWGVSITKQSMENLAYPVLKSQVQAAINMFDKENQSTENRVKKI